MIINSAIAVDQSVDEVWEFAQDIPQVASLLPGAELTDDLGDDQYAGRVAIRMGPVKMQFAGTAQVVERNAETKTLVIDASGSDDKGQGQANLGLTVQLSPSGSGTNVDVTQDIQLSGAAAQYGRGMIGDVTQVLMGDFAKNMQTRLDAIEKGIAIDQAQGAQSASGIAIGIQAAFMALKRVAARFFLPYEPSRV